MAETQQRDVYGFSHILYELMHGGVTYDKTSIHPPKAHELLADLRRSGASSETVKVVVRLLRFHRENLVATGVVSPEVPAVYRNNNNETKVANP